MVRSLGFAYIWETWPDTSPTGCAGMTRLLESGRRTTTVEVLVIGSGAGGATTAALLAEAGLDVLIVEEGRGSSRAASCPFSLEQMDRQYRSGGVTVALGRPSIAYTEGRCAGGGTEVNSGLYRRPSDDTLDRWRRLTTIEDLDRDEFYAACDEVEAALSVQTRARARTRRPATTPRRRRGARMAARRDPALDDLPATAPTRQRRAPEHDPDLPAPRVRGRGADARRASRRPARSMIAGARSGPSSPVPTAHPPRSTSSTSSSAPARSRRRRCCSAPDTAAWSGGPWPCTRPSSWPPASPTTVNVPDDVPVHQVKEFAPDLSFGGSASHPGLVALALTDHWPLIREAVTDVAPHRRLLRGDHQRGAGPGHRDPRSARPARHLPAHAPRPRRCSAQGLARLALVMLEAGARRGLPVVPRRADRPPPARPRRRCTASFATTEASVMTVHLCSTVPMGEDRPRAAPTASDACTAPTTSGSTTPRCCRRARASTRRRR